MKQTIMLIALFFPFLAQGTEKGFNTDINTGTPNHYVFYLHGRIIEEKGERPIHPRFGLYDYPAIIETLKSKDNILITEVRPSGTKVPEYAEKVATQVNDLLNKGITANRITVVGFSKGGAIAMHASSLLLDKNINFVFMASCNNWAFNRPDFKVGGKILSLHEATDPIGISCKPLIKKSPEVAEFTELRLNTGKGHGAFYLPRSEWITPLLSWIRKKASGK